MTDPDPPYQANLPISPWFGNGGGDRFFMDIEPDVEFIFHRVCLSVCVSLNESERVSAHYGAVLADRPLQVARVYKNGKHTAFFQGRTRKFKAAPQP